MRASTLTTLLSAVAVASAGCLPSVNWPTLTHCEALGLGTQACSSDGKFVLMCEPMQEVNDLWNRKNEYECKGGCFCDQFGFARCKESAKAFIA